MTSDPYVDPYLNPYIGVTGFTAPHEVEAILEGVPHHTRKLMVGVIVTWKSLRCIPMKERWAKRTPDPALLADLFLDDPRVVNLVHFSTEKGHEDTILNDMLRITALAGRNFHGFQLNIPWPDIGMLKRYLEIVGHSTRLVLQLGRAAVEQAGGTPDMVARKLAPYCEFVTDILFDPSGGAGMPFDVMRAFEFLDAISEEPDLLCTNLGVAGGLGPHALDPIAQLMVAFPDLNIDAEGKLRTKENELDIEAARSYLAQAFALFDR